MSFLQAVVMKCVLRVARTSHPHFQHLLFDRSKYGVCDLHSLLLNIFYFRENRRRESSNFLLNANKTRKLHNDEFLSF